MRNAKRYAIWWCHGRGSLTGKKGVSVPLAIAGNIAGAVASSMDVTMAVIMAVTIAVTTLCSSQVRAQTLIDPHGWLGAGAMFGRACDDCHDDAMTDASGSPRYVAYTLERLSERLSLAGLDGVLASDAGSARQSYVGIASRFGALSLRRLMHVEHLPEQAAFPGPAYWFDAGAEHAPAYTEIRHDLTYVTPALHGLKAAAMVSFGESTYSNKVNRVYGATLGYAHGPVTLSISRQKKSNFIEATGTTPAIDNSARNTMFAANVGLGIATAYSAYSQHKGGSSVRWSDASPYGMLLPPTQSNDSRDVLFGLAIPLESVTVMATHIRHDDRSAANRDATQFAIGMMYTLSKQTDIFATYARVKNRTAIGGVLDPVSSPGSAAFNIGLRHSF